MSSMADQLVVPRDRAQTDAYFAGWMLSEQRRIFLLCRRMLGQEDEADSAVQDVFLKAYKALSSRDETIDEPAKWLTRIAVNTCLDRLRSQRWQFWRKRPEPRDEEIILGMAACPAPNAEDRAFALEIGKRMAQAMESLSPRQRAVFSLRHYEDKSLEEIAQLLDLDVGTVKAHLARAMAKMREDLKDLYALSHRGQGGGIR
jgi:RNA polymerase sigma-70 factor (ECF subfamily)